MIYKTKSNYKKYPIHFLFCIFALFTFLHSNAAEKITIKKPSDVCMKNFCLDDDVSKYMKYISRSQRVKNFLSKLNDSGTCLHDAEYIEEAFDSASIRQGNDKFTIFFLPHVDTNNKVSLRVRQIYYFHENLNRDVMSATYDGFVNKFEDSDTKKDSEGHYYVWRDDNRYLNFSSKTNNISNISAGLYLTSDGAKKQLERVKQLKPNCYKASQL